MITVELTEQECILILHAIKSKRLHLQRQLFNANKIWAEPEHPKQQLKESIETCTQLLEKL